MITKNKTTETGTQFAEQIGKMLVESIAPEKKQAFQEQMNFKEDNNMGNSGDMYTTVLAKAIWYQSYDMFERYYDATINLTPEDIGMPEGAGAYKLPKVLGSTASKVVDGQVVQYLNNNKDSVILETETYAIGTKIDRRIKLRAARGFIQRLIEGGSDAVHRAVCTDIANGMVAGAAAANNVNIGISYDAIEDSKLKVKQAATAQNVLFGFIPDVLALSAIGLNILAKTTEFKNIYYATQVRGNDENRNKYVVWQGLAVHEFDLLTAEKVSTKAVHGLVLDKRNYFYFLMETGLDTYEGRLPGTAGSEEIIQALDAGMVVANAEACSVISAE